MPPRVRTVQLHQQILATKESYVAYRLCDRCPMHVVYSIPDIHETQVVEVLRSCNAPSTYILDFRMLLHRYWDAATSSVYRNVKGIYLDSALRDFFTLQNDSAQALNLNRLEHHATYRATEELADVVNCKGIVAKELLGCASNVSVEEYLFRTYAARDEKVAKRIYDDLSRDPDGGTYVLSMGVAHRVEAHLRHKYPEILVRRIAPQLDFVLEQTAEIFRKASKHAPQDLVTPLMMLARTSDVLAQCEKSPQQLSISFDLQFMIRNDSPSYSASDSSSLAVMREYKRRL